MTSSQEKLAQSDTVRSAKSSQISHGQLGQLRSVGAVGWICSPLQLQSDALLKFDRTGVAFQFAFQLRFVSATKDKVLLVIQRLIKMLQEKPLPDWLVNRKLCTVANPSAVCGKLAQTCYRNCTWVQVTVFCGSVSQSRRATSRGQWFNNTASHNQHNTQHNMPTEPTPLSQECVYLNTTSQLTAVAAALNLFSLFARPQH